MSDTNTIRAVFGNEVDLNTLALKSYMDTSYEDPRARKFTTSRSIGSNRSDLISGSVFWKVEAEISTDQI